MEDQIMTTTKLDSDGFPPCTMTPKEFCAYIKEIFDFPGARICAFRVRACRSHSTLSLKRGAMRGARATKTQREACAKAEATK
jgi:hypothetical protein